MKAIFIWDDENVAHIARHGHTTAEVERAVQDNRNDLIWSYSTGRPGMIVRTRPRERYAIFWDAHDSDPWTIRVTTMYRVS